MEEQRIVKVEPINELIFTQEGFKTSDDGWSSYEKRHKMPGVVEYGWHFHLSVEPSEKNLEKTLNALENLIFSDESFLQPHHPTIKIRLRSSKGEVSADPDELGKIFVYMDFVSTETDSGFMFQPDGYKSFMLKIWKALEDKGVEFNYKIPPEDEFELDCDDEILTPICYSSYKPYKLEEGVRHGILHNKSANPNNYPNPLEGVRITKADVFNNDIRFANKALVSAKRVQYQRARLEEAKLQFSKDIKSFLEHSGEQHCQRVLEWFGMYLNIKKNDTKELNYCCDSFVDDVTSSWLMYLPRKADSKLSPIFNLSDIKQCRLKSDDEEKASAYRDLLTKIKTEAEAEIQAIKAEWKESNLFSILATTSNIKLDYEQKIERFPAEAQALYRRHIHIKNAEKRLQKEEARLKTCKFPDSYQEIWNETEGDNFAKAKALLKDYSKDDSSLKLFLTFHLNRHHTKEINDILNKSDVTDFNSLMNAVNKLEFRVDGSLARRLAFIEIKTNISDKVQQSLQKNDNAVASLSSSQIQIASMAARM